jgi:23S rRNA (cytidine1920-2'-O)/16S rRNA (cytidine1409-2'-O)-methyltransferase
MKVRLDKSIVDRGLAESRERAKALVLEGKVMVGGVPATKAGTMVAPDALIEMRGSDIPYVGRGGMKLESALDGFGLDPAGLIAMDVGASTGGFTDCLLQRGATKIYAVDVGYGQFDWKLRNDERVVLLERTNIRKLEQGRIPEPVDMAVIDVSFISLKLVVPKVMEFLRSPGGIIVALVKPQFEAGRADVGKGGIVRDESIRLRALMGVIESVEGCGLSVKGRMESPIRGQKGNIEYLIYAKEE